MGRARKTDAKGRPVIDSPAIRKKLLAGVAEGVSLRRLCGSLGVPENQVYDRRANDPEFAKQWSEALLKFERGRLGAIRDRARDEWKAQAWLLERRWPDEYGQRKPGSLTPDQVTAYLRRVAIIASELLPPDKQQEFEAKLLVVMAEALTMAQQQMELDAESRQ